MKDRIRDRIIVPLDAPDLESARRLLERLDGCASVLKVGKELFTAAGPAAVELARRHGARVFLDLKYHDIPNTVAGAVKAAARLGVWMMNVHVSGGRAMMEAARGALDSLNLNPTPLLIGVTALTSLDERQWREVYGDGAAALDKQAARMARLAVEAGLDGVVASPLELKAVRRAGGSDMVIVTPGVRPIGSDAHDQRRVATPSEAVADGADYLVIGRPIAQSDDPPAAMERILTEIAASPPSD